MAEQVQILGRTGLQTSPEGQYAPPALDGLGRQLVKGGDFETAHERGRLFVATSATGGIALIALATSGHPTLWNPANSGRVISVRKLVLAYVSGTLAPGSIGWNITVNAGSVPATGSPILTATQVAVVSAKAGGAVDAKAIWSPTTNTFTTAPPFYRPTSFSMFTPQAATAVAPFQLQELYDGDLSIEPGTALSLVAQQTTTTALFRIGIVFEEVDY